MAVEVDALKPPPCPRCGKLVFRPGTMATMMDGTSNLEGAFTVCMYCSAIWELHGTMAELRLTEATPAQIAAAPFLKDAADQFAFHRVMAARIGMPYVLFADLVGKANTARRRPIGKPS